MEKHAPLASASGPRDLFWRVWIRSLTLRRPQAVLALVSVAVSAAAATMLVNLYGDARRKMSHEFRAYGSNIIVTAAAGSGRLLDESVAHRVAQTAGAAGPSASPDQAALSVPKLFVAVRVRRGAGEPRRQDFENAVVVGTNIERLYSIYPTWRVEGSPTGLRQEDSTCVIGARVSGRLHLRPGDELEFEVLPAEGVRPAPGARFTIAAIFSTGATEDDQVFVPLAALQRLSGLEGRISLVEAQVPGDAPAIERVISALRGELPGADVRPVRQIVESSGQVLGTVRGLLISLTTLILLISAICIVATMTAIVLERRKDIALMKSMGAPDGVVVRLFLAESAAQGMMGGLVGFFVGVAVAGEIARRMFDVRLSVVWWTLAVIPAASALLAVLAAMVPVGIVRGVQPAVVLKGE